MFTEIMITIRNGQFHQIAFINNGMYEFIEPFEDSHRQYLNLDITVFKIIQ